MLRTILSNIKRASLLVAMGSMALTAAGQEALDSLDIQGCGA